ncbi:MAG: phosphonate metabolism protein/1,5-bisphosphokinase (PRPP-forming) PhnN [Rhodopseudomonas sp.]|nr:phosphonate metabolism protein/1,5-bisphosphokinase (PRPP-forming) PhnN [Rhodopseudomonas sp.]
MTTPSSPVPPAPARIGPGHLLLVVGPSGAGKDTVIAGAKAACAENPDVVFPRRVVTRAASAAEDHDSLDEAGFNRALTDGAFAFWWPAHDHRYGIPRTIDDDIRAGRTVVCNVSRGIVAELRLRYANVLAVRITAPADILAARLAGRGRSSDGALPERIKRNEAYVGFQPDRTIDNSGSPAAAIRRLVKLIEAGQTA